MLAKPLELRMTGVSARETGQHRLREQSFPPECNESFESRYRGWIDQRRIGRG
jgi:hypothetical protein